MSRMFLFVDIFEIFEFPENRQSFIIKYIIFYFLFASIVR